MHPANDEQRRVWSTSDDSGKRKRAAFLTIPELYHLPAISEVLQLQLRLYSHGRSYVNWVSEDRDVTHAQEIADRISDLLTNLGLVPSRDAEKARLRQAEELANRVHVHMLREEKRLDPDDDTDDGSLLADLLYDL